MKVVQILSIVTSSMSVFANALVCHVIVRLKNMQTPINYIILKFSVLDAITGVLGIFYVMLTDHRGSLGLPLLQQAYNKSYVLVEVLCRIQRFYWIGITYSPYLLVSMAYERYKAIVEPFSRLNGAMSKKKLRVILPVVWGFGSGYVIFDTFIVTYDSKERICTDEEYPWYKFKVYYAVFVVTQYIIPSLIMFVLYFRLIKALRKQDITLGSQAEAERARRKSTNKVMWIIFVVTLTFYICCGIPNILIVVNEVFDINTENIEFFQTIFVLFTSLNAIFNPFIYFMFIQSFRNGLKQIVSQNRCLLSSRPIGPTSPHFSSISFENNSICMESNLNQKPQLLAVRFLNNTP